jgi:hypothetical protein
MAVPSHRDKLKNILKQKKLMREKGGSSTNQNMVTWDKNAVNEQLNFENKESMEPKKTSNHDALVRSPSRSWLPRVREKLGVALSVK